MITTNLRKNEKATFELKKELHTQILNHNQVKSHVEAAMFCAICKSGLELDAKAL